MSKYTHTPVPWERAGRTIYKLTGKPTKRGPIDINIFTATVEGQTCVPEVAEENAKFILRACNAHDDLLAACKAALEYDGGTNIMRESLCPFCGQPMNDRRQEPDMCHDGGCPLHTLRAAIAKAEGA